MGLDQWTGFFLETETDLKVVIYTYTSRIINYIAYLSTSVSRKRQAREALKVLRTEKCDEKYTREKMWRCGEAREAPGRAQQAHTVYYGLNG